MEENGIDISRLEELAPLLIGTKVHRKQFLIVYKDAWPRNKEFFEISAKSIKLTLRHYYVNQRFTYLLFENKGRNFYSRKAESHLFVGRKENLGIQIEMFER